MRKFVLGLFALTLLAEERVDLSAVHRIKTEALQSSKVSDIALQLTDLNGPRLTNSPNFRKACEWASKQLKEWGLQNVKIEKWPFGRGWSTTRFSAHMIEPERTSLIIVPRPWTPGTNGPVTANAVLVPATTTDSETVRTVEKFKGKLKGKIVLLGEPAPLVVQKDPLWKRTSDQEIAEQLKYPEATPAASGARAQFAALAQQRARLDRFFREEGVSILLSVSAGQGGTVMISAGGPRDPKEPVALTSAYLAVEQYNRVARLLQKDIPVKLEIDIQAQFHDGSLDGMNVIAEIPGSKKAEEIVMIGAHIDSWTGGTGALDNGVGVVTAMEAVRILKSLNLKLDRTVRIGLWGGEEQGLLGSNAYVKEHFGNPRNGPVTSQYSKFSSYFNLDYGSGKIRGIYLDDNDMARPIFEAWFKPFEDMGTGAVAIRKLPYGGSDQSSFTAAGLPGFMFMQDPLNYFARFHTNMDTWDNAMVGDVMQNAAILASFAYHAANREELIPRKVLPKNVTVQRALKMDVEYAKVGDESLKLDAFVPDGKGPFPAVIVVHGGGFTAGDKQGVKQVFEPLSNAGFAWFTINYRLAPKYRFPAAVNDLELAIRWLKAHAGEYKVDPNRIALVGESAGGHMVSFAGTAKDPALRVQAVISFFGANDFEARLKTQKKIVDSVKALVGVTEVNKETQKALRKASPATYVRAGLPPYLFFHGTKDNIVPFDQSGIMCDKLKKRGNTCEVVVVEGAGHGLGAWERNPEYTAYKIKMVDWLKEKFGQ